MMAIGDWLMIVAVIISACALGQMCYVVGLIHGYHKGIERAIKESKGE